MNTADYLESLMFSRAHKGFTYAVDAIDAFRSGYCGNLTALYADIGKRHGSNYHGVERCIRRSINFAMDRNPDFFRTLRLPESRWELGITNHEFLLTAAARLSEEPEA